jgi:DNA-binding SARP family transcriptional activator
MSLKVLLLGQFNLKADDRSLDLPSRPAQSLLAYLVLHPDIEHRREKLAALLWPETQDSNARSYLRQALWRVKKTFTEGSLSWQDYLQINDISLRFNNQSDYWLDADQLTAPTDPQSVENMIEIIKLYQGELLPGFYDEWVVLERDRLSSAYIQKMNNLLDCLVENRQWDEVLTWSENWILHGYSPEPAYRALMLAHAGRGEQSQVLTTYKRCEEALDRDLGVGPSPETKQIFERLRFGETKKTKTLQPRPKIQIDSPPFLTDTKPDVEKALFVARENELIQLETYLNQAKNGQGQVIFITGEAGSGKTYLIQEFTQRIIDSHPDAIVASGNCNAQSGIGDPYLPFRDILELLIGDVESRWNAGAITTKHARMLWNTLPLTAHAILQVGPDLIETLISSSTLINRASASNFLDPDFLERLRELVNRKISTSAGPNPQQQNLFNQYAKVLQLLAQKKSLVLIIDDLQWIDEGSTSLFFHIGRQIKGCKILIIGAYRPEEVALDRGRQRHPLESVVNELKRKYGRDSINLDRSEGRLFIKSLLESEPNLLGQSFHEMLYKHTYGHPLFTIELIRGLQERGNLNGLAVYPNQCRPCCASPVSKVKLSPPKSLLKCRGSTTGKY